jgi:uncharacterized protein (TIGR03435 family)
MILKKPPKNISFRDIHSVCFAMLLSFAATGFAASKPAYRFEVAVIKPASDNVRRYMFGGPGTSDPTRVTMTRVSLRNLIIGAFPQYRDHISGPSSLDAEFSVTATLARGSTYEQFQEMWYSLLIERFGFRYHVLVRSEVPAYAIVVAPKGPKLSAAGAFGSSANKWAQGKGEGDYERQECRRCSMAYLAHQLSYSFTSSRVPVVDRTGLTGEFDLRFEYPVSSRLDAPTDSSAFPDGLRPDVGPGLKSISPLLEKQLGLRIVPTRVQLGTMIVDNLSHMPTEN